MLSKAPRGTRDILPKEVYKWQYVEKKFREICALYGYEEMRTPIFEHTEVFTRSVGDTTDIVQKEMYSFTDKGGRDITLKPEGTAGVVRAFIENKLYAEDLDSINDKLIAVWNGSNSGTANCVHYAESRGKNIIYINPNNIVLTKNLIYSVNDNSNFYL